MIELNVPGRGTLKLNYLVCDVNGTLALDGRFWIGVARGFKTLRDRLEIHLVSADTFGTLMQINHQLEVHAHIIPPGDETSQKAEFVRRLGAEQVVAIGQGANDRDMLQSGKPLEFVSYPGKVRLLKHYWLPILLCRILCRL